MVDAKRIRSVRKGRFTVPEWAAWLAIVAIAFFGFFRLQSLNGENSRLIRQVNVIATDYHTNSQNTLYTLCVSGNVLRTNIREYIIAISVTPAPISPALQQTDPQLYTILEKAKTDNALAVTEANKDFADNNCSAIAGRTP